MLLKSEKFKISTGQCGLKAFWFPKILRFFSDFLNNVRGADLDLKFSLEKYPFKLGKSEKSKIKRAF